MKVDNTLFLRLIIFLLITLTGCDKSLNQEAVVAEKQATQKLAKENAKTKVNTLADKYYQFILDNHPEVAFFSGATLLRHDGMKDNRPEAEQAELAQISSMLDELEQLEIDMLSGEAEWITYSYLAQDLKAKQAISVCKTYLWNVNQMEGWHSHFAQIAQLQPVGDDASRKQSISRWSKLPGYIDQEILNLKTGLKNGYSSPQTVVKRVVSQLDGLLALETENSPFYSPAQRDTDAQFAKSTKSLLEEKIIPAFQRYRDYLANEYQPQARTELSVTANPNGLACYQASLFYHTTLERTGQEVYELGQKTVEANKQKVNELGLQAYGLDNFTAIIEHTKADPDDKFKDQEELLAFSRESVKRAEAVMPDWVGNMPDVKVEVIPFEEHEEGTGMSAHYRSPAEGRPGEYRIPLYQPQEQSKGDAETTAFHEAWPGHHLQVATAQTIKGLHPITQLIWFSGPGEGWARYSEKLADEMGLYVTTVGPIKRLAWPARGMVVDPGIHLLGWTREQAKAFMNESARFPAALADEMVDRIAIEPGQLTAYDSGGLEILALRKLAQDKLGENFDIKEFHDRILENGTIPLTQLRAHIENWLDSKPQK